MLRSLDDWNEQHTVIPVMSGCDTIIEYGCSVSESQESTNRGQQPVTLLQDQVNV